MKNFIQPNETGFIVIYGPPVEVRVLLGGHHDKGSLAITDPVLSEHPAILARTRALLAQQHQRPNGGAAA
jgi:hypothetical protein